LYFRCSSRVRSWTVTFSLYVSPISRLISNHCVLYTCYADDTVLYTALAKDSQSGLDRLTNCSVHLKHWFLAHDLLDPTKSEASYFGTRLRLDIFNLRTDIDIADSHIPVHDHLKILGVTIDKHFTFAPHAQCVVRIATIIFRHCVAFVIYCREMSQILSLVVVGSVNRLVNNYTYKLVTNYQLQTARFVREIVLIREGTLELQVCLA